MLIASLPPVHQDRLLKAIITRPTVDAVRYNTGMYSAYDPQETIRRIQRYARPLKKPIFIDLKGRQLRVAEWANLPEGPIRLNHKIQVVGPAKVCFRGDHRFYKLVEIVDGDMIFVDPLPEQAVGQGQSVNILCSKINIERNLLETDLAYIDAALHADISRFMLSFVEDMDYIRELEAAIQNRGISPALADELLICLKIESLAGLDFVRETPNAQLNPYRLVAARDDLMIQIGIENMMSALKIIISKDADAICASRLLLGLESGTVSMADVSDIAYMKMLGYRAFMLSDGISREHFSEAIEFWTNDFMVF